MTIDLPTIITSLILLLISTAVGLCGYFLREVYSDFRILTARVDDVDKRAETALAAATNAKEEVKRVEGKADAERDYFRHKQDKVDERMILMQRDMSGILAQNQLLVDELRRQRNLLDEINTRLAHLEGT